MDMNHIFGKTWRKRGTLYRYSYIEGKFMTIKQKQFWHRRSAEWRNIGQPIIMEVDSDAEEE